MNKRWVVFCVASVLVISGCASVTPPPDRIYWDEVPASTQCTDERSGAVAQYAGSLLASGLGGWDIGAGLALGYFPIVGIGLVTVGLAGGADAGNKFKKIEQCEEFKQYVVLREARNATHAVSEDQSVRARLEQLDELLKGGAINQQEYEEARKRVLSDL